MESRQGCAQHQEHDNAQQNLDSLKAWLGTSSDLWPMDFRGSLEGGESPPSLGFGLHRGASIGQLHT